jgi:uncharacterized membrane protein
MNQRYALIGGSAMAAGLVSCMCLFAFLFVYGELKSIAGFSHASVVLAVAPAIVAATVSSALLYGSDRFEHGGNFANAVRICLLSYPIYFLMAWVAIWCWLQLNRYLPPLERPQNFLRMGETAAEYTFISFIFSVLPAVCIEYFVIRFVRKNWFPARPVGVSA